MSRPLLLLLPLLCVVTLLIPFEGVECGRGRGGSKSVETFEIIEEDRPYRKAKSNRLKESNSFSGGRGSGGGGGAKRKTYSSGEGGGGGYPRNHGHNNGNHGSGSGEYDGYPRKGGGGGGGGYAKYGSNNGGGGYGKYPNNNNGGRGKGRGGEEKPVVHNTYNHYNFKTYHPPPPPPPLYGNVGVTQGGKCKLKGEQQGAIHNSRNVWCVCKKQSMLSSLKWDCHPGGG